MRCGDATGQKSRPKLDLTGGMGVAEEMMNDAKKAISSSKFDDALQIFPRALTAYQQAQTVRTTPHKESFWRVT